MTQQYIGLKVVTAWPEIKATGDSKQIGYAVKYEDGYISWSPKAVFEAAYAPLDPNYNVKVSVSSQDCRCPGKTTAS